MGTVYKISVDVMRGFEQKDPRWAAWSELYSQSQNIFGFWSTTTTATPSKDDLRAISRKRTPSGPSGQRPGGTPSQEIAPFTTKDENQPDFLTMNEDRVAVLKVIRRVKKTTTTSVQGVKVIGDRREPQDVVNQALDSVIALDGVEVLFETDSFMLQSGNENFQEKFEIKETFGEPVLFTFGERQKIFQYGGVLLDVDSWQWKEKFLFNYERYLRGSKAIENDTLVILITNSAIIRGYLLSCSVIQNEQTHGYVGFSFSMFAQDRIPINEIEPSPQDRQNADEDESTPTIFYTISDRVSKATGEALKTLERTAGTIELPEGFQTGFFHQEVASPPTHFMAGLVQDVDDVVNGQKALPLKIVFSPAGQTDYDPPDLPFLDPLPAAYKNEIVFGTLSAIKSVRRDELEATPGAFNSPPLEYFSFRFAEAVQANHAISSGQTLIYAGGVSGVATYTADKMDKLIALAKKGNLSVKVMIVGMAESAGELIKVKNVFRSDDGWSDLSNNLSFDVKGRGLSFEIQLDKAYAHSILPGYNFWVSVYENNVVDYQTPTGYFHAYDSQKMRMVGTDAGERRPKNSADKHVLTDATASFLDDIEPNLDAGDAVFVTLPYNVVDEDNKDNLIPTAKVKVYKVLSQTQLQLGVLTKLPANKTSAKRQLLGKVALSSYKVIVERATSIKLVDAAIKTAVKNPPDGAFSNTDLAVADLVQPERCFPMVQGVHYNL